MYHAIYIQYIDSKYFKTVFLFNSGFLTIKILRNLRNKIINVLKVKNIHKIIFFF